MQTNNEGVTPATIDEVNTLSAPLPGAFELDAGRYSPYLDDIDLTDAQKLELLSALWSIMRSFVELGFDVKICGQMIEGFVQATDPARDGVDSSDTATLEGPSDARSP
jgi:hypothetical protein